uniref:Low-density lipoprotein receptor-related protein 2-like n=1 Tax=Saccoglossus kowalevskii TaxID=10224 RepID=A0ABM0MHE5_SACKO|nr:PREDICTED: low-density lipoprotein receptor-related protein 2-like [Saccoglossus kowalevskii]
MNPTEWATTESNTIVPDTDTVNPQSTSTIPGTTYIYNKTHPLRYTHVETVKTESSTNFADTTSSISSTMTKDAPSIPTVECDLSEFPCDDGGCIPFRFYCDDLADCRDYSDEINCERCTVDQYKCLSGACIDLNYMCDGIADCYPPSDEAYCVDCVPGLFQCMDERYCVPDLSVCDRTIDCQDGSDEFGQQCYGCSVTEFSCDGTKCIQLSEVCNGVSNCNDNADEIDCVLWFLIFKTNPTGLGGLLSIDFDLPVQPSEYLGENVSTSILRTQD